ncbi:MAG: hypothetical protein LKJ25_04080 [Clostridia bacterium]|jgi:hypothetical protein|nr:hypothetical protein [Clostridia bacterium]
MEFDTQFWIQIVIYAISFGVMYGSFKTKLDYLEKKMDKHNQLQDRMVAVEASAKQAHHRLDELREEIRDDTIRNTNR